MEHLTADIRGTSFTETVNAALERRLAALEAAGRPRRWLLCGLHTCGDLACDTLRMFATGYWRDRWAAQTTGAVGSCICLAR